MADLLTETAPPFQQLVYKSRMKRRDKRVKKNVFGGGRDPRLRTKTKTPLSSYGLSARSAGINQQEP